ncbi:CLAVATA3/ESR (CLE)-related protein 21-like [Brassica napus]|uniref:CLAVATA3/ESR (CLE)-related protein 21-like n=1 Tax=Brassica napus TaxID=3708 RepID=UPI002078DCFB|nr:CLAVATA3/ESR (CLE)-related protein 21-like [Brassica napus]
MVILSSLYAIKRDVLISLVFTTLILILSRSSSIQAGRSNTTKRNHNPSVGQLQYYKNHHESVTVEKMSVFDKFRRGSSKVRRKIVGNEEEKRFIPAGPNPLHNK